MIQKIGNEAEKQIELDAHDWIAFAGIALLVIGIFWIYRPAALIFLGGLLVFYAWVSVKTPDANEKKRVGTAGVFPLPKSYGQ